MFDWFSRRRDLQQRAQALYDAIVEEARAPHLFATLNVPDTVDGRLEMLALHMALAIDRLGRAGGEGQKLAQALTETYIEAMDDTMRAIGVGDLSVPRKVKKAAAALFDRHRAFGEAIAAARDGGDGDAAWRAALTHVLAPIEGAAAIDMASLAHYAATRTVTLSTTADDVLLAGRLLP